MTFKKPFRAVPIQLGEQYQAKQKRKNRIQIAKIMGGAIAIGVLIGAVTGLHEIGALSNIEDSLKKTAVSTGFMRAREPQADDHWSSCNAARAAGTSPLHAGEPGYRPELDADNDGVACEPYRKMPLRLMRWL